MRIPKKRVVRGAANGSPSVADALGWTGERIGAATGQSTVVYGDTDHIPIPSVEGLLSRIAGRPYPLVDQDVKVALSGHYFPDLLDHAATMTARLAEVEEELADLKSARDDWQDVAREQSEALTKAKESLLDELAKGDDRRDWQVVGDAVHTIAEAVRELEQS